MKSLDLERFWSWLPTFRVVAEHENLHEASRVLRLSASSISRTIRLLEAELGRTLFMRAHGRLQLNALGRDFLGCVRRSMRLVDDGATAVRGPDFGGPFRFSLPRELLTIVAIPAVARARRSDRDSCFHISHDGDARSVASGVLDLAVVTAMPRSSADVEVHHLGDVPLAIYCGREHPLWSAPEPSVATLLGYPFICATADAIEIGCWPAEHKRRVALQLAEPSLALEGCIASLGLAVLPRAATRQAVAHQALRRVAGPELRPAHIYALRRPLLTVDRANMIMEVLASTVKGLAAE